MWILSKDRTWVSLVVLCMSSDSVNDRIRTETRQRRYATISVLQSHLLINQLDLKAQITGMHLNSTKIPMSKVLNAHVELQ